LIANGAVRQFFPALRAERFPMEFQGLLRIARCDIGKIGNVTRLSGFRAIHERERSEIQDLGGLFDCGRRFDRVGRGRVIRRSLF
jgi:hypothetical protein